MGIFYKPIGAWAADFIPFVWDGVYHLFYLKDYRDRARYGEGTPWAHIATTDFVHFTEHPDALVPGGPDDQDLWPFTGSVIERAGTFHLFFTGHNPYLKGSDRPVQAIMHATSTDLVTWSHAPSNPILQADHARYEPNDWRDPFVFWNEEAGRYWMLLAARTLSGPSHRRGCVALATSPDLQSWHIEEPLWAPSLYFTHECPDLFQEGERWYLLYSTFTERMVTHWRVGPSPNGPWQVIGEDALDGRAYYAAKTAGDGRRRFAFGWLATRAGEQDDGAWQWGGQLVVHEVRQRSDGSLAVAAPREVLAAFDRQVELNVVPERGVWSSTPHIQASAGDGHAWCRLGRMSDTCLFETVVTLDHRVQDAGVVLRADAAMERYYRIRLDPRRQRVLFDRYPRPGDEPYVIERPVRIEAGRAITLRVLVDRSAIVAYVDDEVALSARGYDHARGDIGLFITGGDATFRNPALFAGGEMTR